MIQAEFGAEAYKDCCLACTLGIIVASMAQKLVLLGESSGSYQGILPDLVKENITDCCLACTLGYMWPAWLKS